jgi:xanthine dehydrogenase accessory factor
VDETLVHLRALRAHERRVAMATLVATRGTTPKKEGAKMWVGDGGHILGSVTIGGCVDARVVAEAEAVLRDGDARLVSMTLGDEDAWEMGLTCGGSVDVLVERVDLHGGDAALAAYETADAELARGRPVVIAARLEGGGRLVMRADGGSELSLGDLALDRAVRAHAARMLRAGGGSCVAPVTASGRTTDVFFEVLAPPLTFVIVGATHLAMPLARLARDVGLRTIVIDPRERFATRERFPEADELQVGIASELVAALPLGPTTLVAVLSHDYKIELPVLRTVLRSEAAYVGVLGSRRRGAALRERLAEELRPDQLARMHLPVGLDIGARSVPEIALAILAEALAVARGRRGGSLGERGTP